MAKWQRESLYEFSIEFNRIEKFNEYCKKWLKYFGILVSFESNTEWNYLSIPDLNDYNRIKRNINIILDSIGSLNRLSINGQLNQTFDYTKANNLEERLKENLKFIGNRQFANEICGLAITGNEQRLGGVL